MRIKVERIRILVIPENEIDVAYIEEVLDMKKEGDCAICRRVDDISGDRRVLWGKHKMYIDIKEAEGLE